MPYAIQDWVINTSNTIKGMQSQRYDPRLVHTKEASSGSLHMTGQHFQAAAPIVDGETHDLQMVATLLAGNADAPYVALTAALWYEALGSTAAPGYAAGNVHRQHALSAGALALTGLTWRHGQHAVSRLRIYELSADGTTSPETVSSVALPTQQAWTSGYRLYSATLGGDAVTVGLAGVDLTIGGACENNVAASCRSLGLPYPTALAFGGPHGPIDVEGRLQLQNVAAAPATGDLVLTFKEVDSGGFLSSDTVIITINAEVVPLRTVGGQNGQPVLVDFAVFGIYDGSNKPITITT